MTVLFFFKSLSKLVSQEPIQSLERNSWTTDKSLPKLIMFTTLFTGRVEMAIQISTPDIHVLGKLLLLEQKMCIARHTLHYWKWLMRPHQSNCWGNGGGAFSFVIQLSYNHGIFQLKLFFDACIVSNNIFSKSGPATVVFLLEVLLFSMILYILSISALSWV